MSLKFEVSVPSGRWLVQGAAVRPNVTGRTMHVRGRQPVVDNCNGLGEVEVRQYYGLGLKGRCDDNISDGLQPVRQMAVGLV